MADHTTKIVSIKPKPPILPDFSGLLNPFNVQNSLKERTIQMHGQTMFRQCKLFIRVDNEGLLTDPLAISMGMNFESHESIQNSAAQIISLFEKVDSNSINIDRMFYYKKRARSTRLNPMPIRNTTDGFRAVAEHPAGEVPIGVRWSFIRSQIPIQVTDNDGHGTPVRLKVPPKRESRENEDASKSSQASSGYPTTLMLNTREDDLTRSYEASTPSPASSSLETTSISTTEVVHDKGEPQNSVLREAHVTESANKGKAKFTPALPETATVEVVVRCDGIVERTELKKEIQPIADMLARGDYSFLSEEYKHLLRRGVTAHSKIGTLSNNPAFDSVNKDKKKIHYLLEAKDEIYKLLSRVVLSKHKFKKLLSWMKSLHLVSGKNGKYFLSERNLLGATCVTNGGDKDDVKSSSVQETESWRIAPSALPNPLLQPTVTTGIQKKDTRLFLEPQMFQNPNKLAATMQTSAENKPLFVLMPNKPVSTSQATSAHRPSLNTSISGVSSACTVPSVVTTTSNVNLSNLVLSSVSLDVEKSTSHSFILKRKKRKSKYDIDHLVSNIENAPSPVPIKLFRVYDTNSDNNSTEHIMLETNSETRAIQEHTGNDNRVGLSRMRTRKSKLNDHDSSIQEQDSEEFEESERLIQESQYGEDYDNYVVKTEPPDDYE
ncbi:hypothetical protein CHS0354_018860 [Potamilus streckersoni]|uniref:Uncharacterized protein n=1 Tax=Potamilus streckersoni TaxID=2493646 RepID=A0AAE0SCF9_9BIVA|nr:hypothetical protein CHS0354_018860 [Potamilus streckersoni]